MNGPWIEKALAAAGMKQAELARRLSIELGRNIDRQMISKMISGIRRVSADEWHGISRVTRYPLPGMPDGGEDAAAQPGRLPFDGTRLARQESQLAYRGLEQRRLIAEFDVRAGASFAGDNGSSGHADAVMDYWSLPDALERELNLDFSWCDIIQVTGDSMDDGTDRSLRHGDRVLVDRRSRKPLNSEDAFVIWDGLSVLVKMLELRTTDGSAELVCRSRNTTFQAFVLPMDDQVKIVGRVAAVIAKR
jgi:transcriptional regulator with XRE-family HTH domain